MPTRIFKLSLCAGLTLGFFAKTNLIADEAVESETQIERQTIVVEQNDPNALTQIKNELIQYTIEHTVELNVEEVDFDNTDVSLGSFDTSTLHHQEVAVHIAFAPKNPDDHFITPTVSRTFCLRVVDTTAPVLTLSKEKVAITIDSEFDPVEYIVDNYDNSYVENQLEIINPVNTKEKGSATVTYIATDPSKNQTVVELQVDVRPRFVAANAVITGDSILDMLNGINALRAERGLAALSLAPENAQQAIGVRAAEAAGYVSHTRPDGRHYKTAFDDFGVSYSSYGREVLTYSGSTVQDKLNWWCSSPAHFAALMRSDCNTIAIGYSGKMWAAIVYAA